MDANAAADTKMSLDIATILAQAVQRNASDIHITVGKPVMVRLSGKLVPLFTQPLTAEDTQTLVLSLLTPE